MSAVYDLLTLGQPIMDVEVYFPDGFDVTKFGLERGSWNLLSMEEWHNAYHLFTAIPGVSVMTSAGDSVANTARMFALNTSSTDVRYVGVAGFDEYAEQFRTELQDNGVCPILPRAGGRNTGRSLVLVSPDDGERTMLTCLGSSTMEARLIGRLPLFAKTRYAHFTSFTLCNEMEFVTQRDMVFAARANAVISLDVGSVHVEPCVLARIIGKIQSSSVKIVFLNDDQLEPITGKKNYDDALRELMNWGGQISGRILVLKHGARGSTVVLSSGQMISVPSVLTDVVDTTGAGDAYAAGFLIGHHNGWSPKKCAHYASRMASRVVAQRGAVVPERIGTGNLPND